MGDRVASLPMDAYHRMAVAARLRGSESEMPLAQHCPIGTTYEAMTVTRWVCVIREFYRADSGWVPVERA